MANAEKPRFTGVHSGFDTPLGFKKGKFCIIAGRLLIPMKAVTDSDLIPVTRSDVKPVTLGAKRRWYSYGA